MKDLQRLFCSNISKLYPPVSFPVSRGTPMIAPLFLWNHSENHTVPSYDPFTRCDKRNIIISLSDPKYEFMRGHMLDGELFFTELYKGLSIQIFKNVSRESFREALGEFST